LVIKKYFLYLGMEKITLLAEEIKLLNVLNENEIKFKLEIDNSDVDIMPIFKIGNINLCYDFNYLIFSDEIDELRFHNINDLINYLKNN